MRKGIIYIVFRSLAYYRKSVAYQFIIILILSAVITGSILTGFSVRQSLKKSIGSKLGNTAAVISSGVRYFDPQLAQRLADKTNRKCIPLVETNGFCRNLSSGIKSLNVNIFGINNDFFAFHGLDSLNLEQGTVAINSALASRLKVNVGDEININLGQIRDIPANSPFAPSAEKISLVLKVGHILSKEKTGDFSLSISQLTPDNLFINLNDLFGDDDQNKKANRILIDANSFLSEQKVYSDLKEILSPSDIGLGIRKIKATSEEEIISNRIFIDQSVIGEISKALPESTPTLTYLANSISHGRRQTPYSFVSALTLPPNKSVFSGNNIIINRWLADDLGVKAGDTITLTWFAPGKITELIENSQPFVINEIVDQKGIFGDSLLMPKFPGISGKESCSDWDAGIEIKMDRIRKKDEQYWNEFSGTPKAFISYEKGKELWGNNFGPATSIRVPSGISLEVITKSLNGKLDPEKCGFSVKDIAAEMKIAADESIDFTSLFLSLGFFIILSCIILLSLTITAYFESRQQQVSTLYSIGFENGFIARMMFLETGFIAVTASLSGALAGVLINMAIISSLNSVWIGAVQTDALGAYSGLVPIISGFIATSILSLLFLYIKIRRFAKKLESKKTGKVNLPSIRLNSSLLILFSIISATAVILAFTFTKTTTELSFIAGGSLFVTLLIVWRQFTLGGFSFRSKNRFPGTKIGGRYFASHPSDAVAPAIFIAAGLFAVLITGVNRLEISNNNLISSGGTGGFRLWAETSIPLKADLNSQSGRKDFGFDEPPVNELKFVQIRRSSGDDASCLNLNHISAPPLLGIEPEQLTSRKSFSFASLIPEGEKLSPWELLNRYAGENSVYGFADQTVLQWGLKKQLGDTLILRTESGQILNIIIAGALKSSLFQGYVLIGMNSFSRYFPSISGSSIILIDGGTMNDSIYSSVMNERLESYGIAIQPAKEKLASFFTVTNTYLTVFTILGGFGMILGVMGLGFVLLRNYNSRKREFALMMATGFNENSIRWFVLKEHSYILIAGVLTGIIPAIVATMPSIMNGSDIPWVSLTVITILIIVTGTITLLASVSGIRQASLISELRNE